MSLGETSLGGKAFRGNVVRGNIVRGIDVEPKYQVGRNPTMLLLQIFNYI
jgi:hypothetical protein